MTKLWYILYRVIGCLLVLGMLETITVAQQPQTVRFAIDHAPFTRPQKRGAPLPIEATITSPAGIRKAEVFCRAVGGGDFTVLPMASVAENQYRTVVPDWMTAGQGIEYYITATDERGQSTSQGFVGFPLVVQLVGGQSLTQEERLKALQETLDIIRQNKTQEGLPRTTDPTTNRYR